MRARVTAGLLALALLPAAQLLYPGCATLINGPRQGVSVRSVPTGAQVFLNGHDRGMTPVRLSISRWGSHEVRIELPGYAPYIVPLHKTANDNLQGNLFIGVAPIFIDLVSGAVFTHELSAEERQRQRLAPHVSGFDSGDWVVITAVLKRDPSWQKIGQLKRR